MQEIIPTALIVFMEDADGDAYASRVDGDKASIAAALVNEFVEWVPIVPMEITIKRINEPADITIKQSVPDQESK